MSQKYIPSLDAKQQRLKTICHWDHEPTGKQYFQQSLGLDPCVMQTEKHKIQLDSFVESHDLKAITSSHQNPLRHELHETMCCKLKTFLWKSILSLRNYFLDVYLCQAECKTQKFIGKGKQVTPVPPYFTPRRLEANEKQRQIKHKEYMQLYNSLHCVEF